MVTTHDREAEVAFSGGIAEPGAAKGGSVTASHDVTSLPERYRRYLELRAERVADEQIAEDLGVPVESLDTLAWLAERKLRRIGDAGPRARGEAAGGGAGAFGGSGATGA